MVTVTKTESFEAPIEPEIAAAVDAWLTANLPSGGGGGTPFDGDAGEYTPSLAHVSNVSASAPHPMKWMRIKDIVTVAGNVDFTETAISSVRTDIRSLCTMRRV